MAHYPQSAVGLNYITYPAGPTAAPSTVTAGNPGDTKGLYVEYIASSPFECNYLQVNITRGATGLTFLAYLVDIATGAGGAETVIIPNISFVHSTNNTSHGGAYSNFPLTIAASTRIAGRCQCNSASSTLIMALGLQKTGDTPGPTSYLMYGASTSNSLGTSIDPGGTINTKGAYSQISASISAIIQIIQLCLNTGTNSDVGAAQWAVDLAIGAAASEVVLIPDLRVAIASEANSGTMHAQWQLFLTYIAASTRLAIRASCDINDATDRLLRATVIAATAPAESGGGGQRSYVG